MKRLLAAAVFGIAFVSLAYAEATKTYQVTGPILELTKDKIVVEKDKEKWEIQEENWMDLYLFMDHADITNLQKQKEKMK